MDRPREFGRAGLSLQPGDHICALYRTPEQRDDIVASFVGEGLRTGDRCICIVDSSRPLQLLAGAGSGIDVGYVASGQLEVRSSSEAYLRCGRFSPQELLAYLGDSVSAAVADGRFPFVRVIGEMPPSLSDSPQEELFAYESDLDRFAARYPQAIVCLYRADRFAGIIMGLLKTHDKVLFDDVVFEGWGRS